MLFHSIYNIPSCSPLLLILAFTIYTLTVCVYYYFLWVFWTQKFWWCCCCYLNNHFVHPFHMLCSEWVTVSPFLCGVILFGVCTCWVNVECSHSSVPPLIHPSPTHSRKHLTAHSILSVSHFSSSPKSFLLSHSDAKNNDLSLFFSHTLSSLGFFWWFNKMKFII